jgi:hypothetical protein
LSDDSVLFIAILQAPFSPIGSVRSAFYVLCQPLLEPHFDFARFAARADAVEAQV